jgi:hypothetical protein
MIDGFAGATVIDTRIAGVTVNGSFPCTEAELAVIVAEPAASAVTSPLGLTVTIPVGTADQVADSVMDFWLPSL